MKLLGTYARGHLGFSSSTGQAAKIVPFEQKALLFTKLRTMFLGQSSRTYCSPPPIKFKEAGKQSRKLITFLCLSPAPSI